jgi:hypothetical protein
MLDFSFVNSQSVLQLLFVLLNEFLNHSLILFFVLLNKFCLYTWETTACLYKHVEISVCLSFDPSSDPVYQTVLSLIPSRLSYKLLFHTLTSSRLCLHYLLILLSFPSISTVELQIQLSQIIASHDRSSLDHLNIWMLISFCLFLLTLIIVIFIIQWSILFVANGLTPLSTLFST